MIPRVKACVLGAFALALLFCGLTWADKTNLVWSTFLGGVAGDVSWDIALDRYNNIYLTGYTSSEHFPTTAVVFDTTYNGGGDVFVVKLDATGRALVYSTFLGGDSYEVGKGIAVDGDGNAYVTGETYSNNFPSTSGAFDQTHNAGRDSFVLKLNPTGSDLDFSTFLGGTHDDRGLGIAVDGSGEVYLTGKTYSDDFPTTQEAFDPEYNGNGDAFMAKLNVTGSALFCATFLGGGGDDSGRDMVLDEFGNPLITGYTKSDDFPATHGAFDTTQNGNEDVFVAKIDPTGSTLSYATFLGGGGDDKGFGIVLDNSGRVYLTGYTKSADFPTTEGAFDTTLGGNVDLFVAKLNVTGSAVDYVTCLGGSRQDYGHGIAMDGDGHVHVTGYTKSADFPITAGPFDDTHNGSWDLFVIKLNATGRALDYGTFMGGSSWEKGFGIAVDGAGNAYVTGYTWSSDFPTTTEAYRATYTGKYADAFVAKLKLDDNR